MAFFYFLSGFIALLLQGLFAAEILFVLAGFFAGQLQVSTESARSWNPSKLQLGFLIIMGILCAVVGFFCFLQFSLFTVFPGLPAAIAFGQVNGILARLWELRDKRQGTAA